MAFHQSDRRAPLSELQRNFTFSTEKARGGFKAPPTSDSKSFGGSGTPPPPTLTTEDLLHQGDDLLAQPTDLLPVGQTRPSVGSTTRPAPGVLAAPVPLATPVASATPAIAAPPQREGRHSVRRSRNASFSEIITWADPVKSAIVFVAGCVALAVLDHFLKEQRSMSPVACLASCTLLLLSFHFLGSLFSDSHQKVFGLSNAARLQAMQSALCKALEGMARVHDRLMISPKPRTSLKVALALWGISIVGSFLSAWALLCLSYGSLFLLPLGWKMYGARLRAAASSCREQLLARIALMGLSRAHAIGIQLMLLFSMWLNASLSNRLISLAVGVIAIRCQLDSNEVESIRATAEPYTMSVKKTASRVSRYIGTYSASKHHQQ
eukprot:jgi/Tetstr1/442713/TSEL_030803.t1